MASSPPWSAPRREYTPKEAQISTAKGTVDLSFLLNPFGLGFPWSGQSVREEGCPRAHGHPSGDIQAVTNPRVPCCVPSTVGLFPAGRWGSSHCGAPGLGETVKDVAVMETGPRPPRRRSLKARGGREGGHLPSQPERPPCAREGPAWPLCHLGHPARNRSVRRWPELEFWGSKTVSP